jgi:hydroxypyruvate isomerase
MTYKLAACAEMIFQDLPFIERVNQISSDGFLVEIWDWSNKDLPALAATGATFSSMTGYLEGDLITDEGANRLLETAALSLEQAKIIDAPRLNLHGTGLGEGGLPVKPTYSVSDADWNKAVETLTRMAELAAKHNRVFTLENLNNAVDHPGVPFAKAADTLELVKRVNHPHLRLNLDLYHAQIGEGNLTQLVSECFEWIGEIQVADVPGRAQPGSGEIYYPRIAKELKGLNYQGVIAMEAFATGESHQALAEFRSAFTV